MQKSLTNKQQFWFNHVIAAESCSLPLSAYAAQHNLSAKSLYNWRWKFTQQKSASIKKQNSFIKMVAPTNPTPKMDSATDQITQATLPNGIVLVMPKITSEILSMLLRA